MIRRPPRSTLFPYNDALPICSVAKRRTGEATFALASAASTGRPASSAVVDRKSTRLNSSHRCISYAVFCLKKKKTKDKQKRRDIKRAYIKERSTTPKRDEQR